MVTRFIWRYCGRQIPKQSSEAAPSYPNDRGDNVPNTLTASHFMYVYVNNIVDTNGNDLHLILHEVDLLRRKVSNI